MTEPERLKAECVHLIAEIREIQASTPPKYDHCEAFRAALRQANPASVDIGGEDGKSIA